MTNPQCKITVATVTWNAAAVLQRTLDSVAEQDYPFVQHVVVDGCSSDDTLTLLRQYQERESTEGIERHEIEVLSESDKGLYDAMNKAILMADGDYIIFLNAGDRFHQRDTLSKIADKIAEADSQIPNSKSKLSTDVSDSPSKIEGVDAEFTTQTGAYDNSQISNFKSEPQACQSNLPAVVYGDTDIVDDQGRFLRKRHLRPPKELHWRDYRRGMLVCHQAFFVRTDLATANPYNLRYRYSADYDWSIRVMKQGEKQNQPIVNASIVVADYLDGGMTVKHHRRSLLERLRIMACHYGWPTAVAMHLSFIWRALKRKFSKGKRKTT